MRHGSLFSGIGGFDLAAQWMGWKNVFHCEWNEFGQRILKHYWPNATSYGDITKTDFTIWRGRVDVLSGGFPCQPYSQAGKRKGKEDERHLWPEMLRAIREIEPRYIVGENVRGLVNWSGGLVFDEVQADLEGSGYEVIPFLLPACAVNAPHRRDRIWFVAYSKGKSSGKKADRSEWHTKEYKPNKRKEIRHGFVPDDESGTTTNANGTKQQRKRKRQQGEGSTNGFRGNNTRTQWEAFPTQPPICSRNDGLSDRLDGITFPKWRNESIKAYGNAIVPQVAYEIFKSLQNIDKFD